MIIIALLHCNPLFQLIPSMINESNAEFKDELIKHMTKEASIEFGPEISKWLNLYYEYINDQVSVFCRGFKKAYIRDDLHQASLFVSLLVKGNIGLIGGATFMVMKWPNIYNALKTKALLKTSHLNQIDDRLYGSMFFDLCNTRCEEYFKNHQ